MRRPRHDVAIATLAAVALAGCHTHRRLTTVRPGRVRTEPSAAPPRALPPTTRLDADGALRFVAPLRCATEVVTELEVVESVRTQPNLATFVVGVVASAAAGVATARGLAGSGVALGLGIAGLAVGLPLAIGPLRGNGIDDRLGPGRTVRRPGGETPCGERAVAATRAVVRAGPLIADGAVDADGRFEVSPFSFVDAFAVGAVPGLPLTAELTGADGEMRVVESILDAAALASARDGFLAAAGVDGRVEPLRKVPVLEPGPLRVSRLAVDGLTWLRVVAPLRNRGPGDAWQLRGVITADHPELDGRVLYVGHLAAGDAVAAELRVPLSAAADAAVTGDELDLRLELRDAHGAAPAMPVRYRGRPLADIPR
jgi:hypothetical protein